MRRPFQKSARGGVLLVALSVGLSCNFDQSLACPPQNVTENETQVNLHLKVIQGADAVNILKSKMAVKPIIEVRDKNNLPVAGAAVMFTAPESGPRVAFVQGNTFMATTDANGWAVVTLSKPVGLGAFKIRVSANSHGEVATTSIAQTNYENVADVRAAGAIGRAGPGAATTGGGMSGTKIAIIAAGVAAAIGVGLAAGKGGGSKGSSPGPVPTGTIGSGGTPTITAPH